MHINIYSTPGRRRWLEGGIKPDDRPEKDAAATWRAGISRSSSLLFALHIEEVQLERRRHIDISSPSGRGRGLEGGIQPDDQLESDAAASWRDGIPSSSSLLFALHIEEVQLT